MASWAASISSATKAGRTAVDALLRDMENHEERFGGPTPFDFSEIRRELGLGD